MGFRGYTLLDETPGAGIEVWMKPRMTARQAMPGADAPASATFTATRACTVILDRADGLMLHRSRASERAGTRTTPSVDGAESVPLA